MSQENINTNAAVERTPQFTGIDFAQIANDENFKEDSVRERIILPILHALGYDGDAIVRSMALKNPILKTGTSKRKVTMIPDYVLRVGQCCSFVLDAKAPSQRIIADENVEQVYSYATHIEIRSPYFALCNGIQFAVYLTSDPATPILFFDMQEIEVYWSLFYTLLQPDNFIDGKDYSYKQTLVTKNIKEFIYNTRTLLKEVPVRKRATKRHFGVHGYFTKQSWDIVQSYIRNYTKPDDVVLDPFGGSGVTAIEAMMTSRKGIHVDLNPFSVFLTESLTAPVNFSDLYETFDKIKKAYEKDEPKTAEEIQAALEKYPQPKDLLLPKGSDVETVWQLFSDKQRAQLSFLKYLIKKQKDKNIQKTLLLMFSGIVTRKNLTFHTTKNATDTNISGGDAAAFRYYRYRIAPNPIDLDLMKYFEMRFQKVVAAKREMEYHINANTIGDLKIYKGDATNLIFIEDESVDYIYTDPPYGAKIPYLDLSTMWNAWLDLEVSEEDFAREAIVGGEHNKSKDEYNSLMAKSIQEMFRVLKYDRWLSFVFYHKDPQFWDLILNTAQRCGFEYVGAVAQKNGQTSFKKRQNPFTVLSGELIINFKKVKNPKTLLRANLGMDLADALIQTMEGVVAKNDGATLEEIYSELIIKGMEMGFTDLLAEKYSDMSPFLDKCFDYDPKTEKYYIKKDKKFTSHIDVELRAKYYIVAMLRRSLLEEKDPSFDEIVLHVIPLLKNGTTPDKQTILSVLEDVADKTADGCWRLKSEDGQGTLF